MDIRRASEADITAAAPSPMPISKLSSAYQNPTIWVPQEHLFGTHILDPWDLSCHLRLTYTYSFVETANFLLTCYINFGSYHKRSSKGFLGGSRFGCPVALTTDRGFHFNVVFSKLL